jgi:hypothetical protein
MEGIEAVNEHLETRRGTFKELHVRALPAKQ